MVSTAPKQVQDLQNALAVYLKGRLGQTANQYPGPVSAGINPLMTGAANIMSNYAGQGNYTPPAYNTYGTFMPSQAQAPQTGAGGSNPMMTAFLQQFMGQGSKRTPNLR